MAKYRHRPQAGNSRKRKRRAHQQPPGNRNARFESLEDRRLLASDFGNAPPTHPTPLDDDGAGDGFGIDAAFYTAVLDAVLITDHLGNQLDGDGDGTAGDDFQHVLLVAQKGDSDVDGDVDLSDYTTLAANFDPSGQYAPYTWCDADFEADGDIDLTDYNLVAETFAPGGYAGTTPAGYELPCAAGEPAGEAATTFSDQQVISSTADGAISVFATDMDDDGDTDVLSASFYDDRIAWYENNGDESFTAHTINPNAVGAWSVYATDVDSDGDVDVLSASYEDDTVAWYENDGSENFTAHTISTSALSAYSVFAVDMDDDGDVDVLSATLGDNQISWYENDGSENFTAHTISTDAIGAWSVTAADVDGDGDMDVLSASRDDDKVAWYENDGSENFTAHTISTSADGPVSVFAVDVDGDGDIDVLSASGSDNKVAWYENDGSENFTAHTISTNALGTYRVVAVDVDDDDDIDVLSASFLDHKIAWYENDGSENFTEHAISLSATNARSVFVADVNGDGALDVLSASSGDDKIAWYKNLNAPAVPAPQVVAVIRNGGNDTFDTLETLAFTFSGAVTVNANALSLINNTASGTLLDLTGVAFDYNPATFTATWDFSVSAPPTFDLLADLSISEDAVQQTIHLAGISDGEQGIQPLRVSAVSSNPTLIPQPVVAYVSPDSVGSLTFTPLPDASGTATITVTVEDGGPDNNLNTPEDNATFSRTFNVTVQAVNDAPTLDPIANLTIEEDASQQMVHLAGITAGGGESQSLKVTAASSNPGLIANPAVSYTSANSAGSLKFTPVAGQSGTATITVTAEDAGLDNNLATPGDNATFSRTFDVTVLPDEVQEDFGDAPAPYPVTLAENGARHTATGPTLGATRDTEADGTHSAAADADGADEDGITFGVVRPGQLDATIIVNVQNAPSSGAKLDGWIDFNADGNWGGSDERVFARQPVTEGENVLTFDVPSWTPSEQLVARFRLSTAGVDTVTGMASNGEVEDVLVPVLPPVESTLSFGAPITLLTSGTTLVRSLDFDNDGDVDFFGTLNNGNGFWGEQTAPGTFVSHDLGYAVVDAVDIDFDGDMDFLGLDNPAKDLVLLKNIGNGSFDIESLAVGLTSTEYSNYDSNGNGRIADVDGDGDLDIAMLVKPNSGAMELHLIEQLADGWTSHVVNTNAGTVGYDLHFADLDKDGDLDLTFTTYDGPYEGRVGWYRNEGDWSFTQLAWTTTFGQATNAIPVDFDADGDMDVLATGPSDLGDEIELFRNDNNSFTQVIPQSEITPHTYGVNSIFPADLDGNGNFDIVWGDWWGRSVGWVPHRTASPYSVLKLHTFGTGGNFIWADDVNADGTLDILVGNRHASGSNGSVYLISNTGYVTLDDISDLTVAAGTSQQTVAITGIGSNRTGGSTLRITATSSDNQLVTAPVVTYASADSTGSVAFTPVSGQTGATLITVTVEDAGADGDLATTADNATFSRDFAVTVEAKSELSTRIYWADGKSIYRSLSDGSGLEAVVTNTGNMGRMEFDIDSSTGRLITASYSVPDQNDGSWIHSSNLDGSDRTIVRDTGWPLGVVPHAIAVNPQNSDIFYSPHVLEDYVPSDRECFCPGGMQLLSSDGSSLTTFSQRPWYVEDIQVDPDNGHVYYTVHPTFGGGPTGFAGIRRMNLDGTGDTTILSTGGSSWLALDVPRGHFYYAENTLGDGSDGRTIYRANLDGSNVQTIIADTGHYVADIDYDPVADRLIFHASNSGGNFIFTANLDGTGLQQRFSIDTGSSPIAFAYIQQNSVPTLNPINNITIAEDAAQQTVNLAGITAGGGESQPLRVTATSSNTGLIPNPAVTYTTANATGSLAFTPVTDQTGTATITVMVEDGGLDSNLSTAGDNATFSRTFNVTVNVGNDTSVESSVKLASSLNGVPSIPTNNLYHAPSTIGDFDGDGITDLVVSSRGLSGQNQPGSVYIHRMNADGTVRETTSFSINSPNFGNDVAAIGDVNGDGVVDLVVGSNVADGGNGAVFICFLNSDGTLQSSKKIGTNLNGGPPLTDDNIFGGSVAGLGDINGDNIPDIGVGAYLRGGTGSAFVITLNADGTAKDYTELRNGLNGLPPNTLAPGDAFGYRIEGVNDLNDDGIPDVAVQSPGDGGIGAVYVLFLASDGTVNSTTKLESNSNGVPLLNSGDSFGRGIGVTDDLDGNGVQDLIVGARSDDTAGHDRGAIYILFMESDGTVGHYTKITDGIHGGPALNDGDLFGDRIATIGDLDGNGAPELAVLAAGDDTSSNNQGAIHVLFLSAVNSKPTLNAISNVSIDEDAAQQTVNLAGITAGGGESQPLRVTASSSTTGLIPNPTVTYTSANTTGSIAFTPVADQHGTATITVTVEDGGLDNDLTTLADNASFSRTFDVTVEPLDDFGDAPVPYPVTLAENGARHTATGPTLGATRDTEADGTHSAAADADGADEDGVTFGVIQVGALDATLTANVQNAVNGAKLDGWMDFNGDGNWGGLGEQIFDSVDVANGDNALTFDVPSWAASGTTYARFRLSTTGGLGVGGLAPDGEVEDYQLSINPPAAASGIFGGQNPISVSADYAVDVFAADVDGDGDMDVLSASSGDDKIAWYENDGSQTFTPHTITSSANQARSVYAADLDGDGDIDVVSASIHDHRIAWYENNGSQIFTTRTVSTAANGPTSIFVADVDGDGDIDVLSSSQNDDQVAWYENDGSETFTHHTITTSADGAFSVFAADVDQDGDMDVLSASYYDDTIAWYENNGSQVFTPRTITTIANGARSVFAADLDEDGDMDVLSASQADDKIAWYENNGNQTFTPRTITTTANGARSVFAADVDGDGDIDVLSASTDDDKIAWYKNDGSQTFTQHTVTTAANVAASVFATDVDGDGDLDIVSASAWDDKIAWYENLNNPETNASPTLDPISDVTIDEDAPQQTVNLTGISAGEGESQLLRVTATSNNPELIPDPTVDYTAASSTGSFTFTPLPDQSGTATITVTVEDGGLDNNLATSGDNATQSRTFEVTITPVNDIPTLDAIADVTIDEDAPEQTVGLTGITAGGGEAQLLRVTATSNNPELIPHPTVDYTTASSTGSFTFTPLPDQDGTATITVTLEDGGLDNNLNTPGDNATFNRTFHVTVNAGYIEVTTATDEVNGLASGNGVSLREAIIEANTNGTPTEIVFSPALNGVPIVLTRQNIDANTDENGAMLGDLDVTSDVTITGNGVGNTIISGEGLGTTAGVSDRVFHITSGITVTITGVTITKGTDKQTPIGSSSGFGGGIYNQGTLELESSAVTNNTASIYGGGIFNTGTLTLRHTDVSNNIGSSASGGGIRNTGTLTVYDSTITENQAAFSGGGIESLYAQSLTVIRSTIASNRAHNGGGIISNNSIVLDSTISGNVASYSGGGIHFNPLGATGFVANTTVSGNSVSGSGGGISTSSFSTVTVINSTVYGNDASQGGGIANASYATLVFRNSIVVGNTSPDGADVNTTNATLTSNGANIFGSVVGASLPAGDQVGISAASVINTTLADNGGPTLTHALVNNSSAINRGINAHSVDNLGATLTTDQRGFPRPYGGTVDIGAFEEGNPNPETGYSIEIVFTDNTLTTSQRAVFTTAAHRWSEIIVGDVPAVEVPGIGLVDDLLIYASAPTIDGVGGILGQAAPTSFRESWLPSSGFMEFDGQDLADMESEGVLLDLILHEMGHVIGIGTIWSAKGLLQGAGGSDPRFIGQAATQAYNDIFGNTESSVPVANTGGPGTADAHWRKEVFDNELMTGYLNMGGNLLSRVTAGSLADLGYTVNLEAADNYTSPSFSEPGEPMASSVYGEELLYFSRLHPPMNAEVKQPLTEIPDGQSGKFQLVPPAIPHGPSTSDHSGQPFTAPDKEPTWTVPDNIKRSAAAGQRRDELVNSLSLTSTRWNHDRAVDTAMKELFVDDDWKTFFRKRII